MCIQLHKEVRPIDGGAIVVFAGDDGYGSSARARRLESLAERGRIGQVLAVGKVIATLGPVTTNLRIVSLGTHRFEDMLPEEEVASLSIGAGFDAPTFNLEGLDLYDHNLPVFFDSFVGRDGMIDEVIGAADTTRLVTLVGCGGVGKTRLAIHAAARLMLDGFHVLRLVRLAEADRGGDIGSVVAAKAGIRSARIEDFVGAYRAKRCLFVIDNCEHVLASAVSVVRRIITEIPGALVLVTSREILDLGGEVAIEVPPLSLPGEEYDFSSIERSGAVELFVDRLRERAPEFQVGEECLDSVVSLCRRLDGLPLALEHAAGQAAYLGLEECERGLSRRFDLLRSERRDYDERHRTVWATIDWSYGLLSDKEKHCLCSLSVFAGSFSMSDATAIVSDEVVDETSAQSVLTSLIRKSLVVREFDSRGNAVYHMLETVRDFARAQCVDRGDRMRARHFEHIRGLVDSAFDTWEGKASPVKFADLQGRYVDVKAGLDWGVEADHPSIAETLRRLTRYWIEYGPISDGVRFLKRAVQPSIDSDQFSCDHANALAAMLWMDGKFDEARPIFERVLSKASLMGDLVTAATAHNNLAGLSIHSNDASAAVEHFRLAYGIYQEAGESGKAAMCAANLGYQLARAGEQAEAINVLRGALSEGRGIVPFETEAVLLLNLSDALRFDGRIDECLSVLCEVLSKCSANEHASSVPKAVLRACIALQKRCGAEDVARLYGIASQGFAEFSSTEFGERAAMQIEVVKFLGSSLVPDERDRIVAGGAVVIGSQRVREALIIIKKALDMSVE